MFLGYIIFISNSFQTTIAAMGSFHTTITAMGSYDPEARAFIIILV